MADENVSLTGFMESERYKEISSAGQNLLEVAQKIQVTNRAEFDGAANVLRGVRSVRAKIADFFSPLKSAANKLHKEITGREKEVDGPYRGCEETIRRKMENFVTEEKRRITEEAERLRRVQEESILKMATDAESRGDNKAADALINLPVTKMQGELPMPENLSTRQQLVIEVTDITLLMCEAIEGRIPASIFMVETSAIKEIIKQYGMEHINSIKGLKCFYKPVMVMKK